MAKSRKLSFKILSGSARHFLGSNGREYTRRQRDNILARRAGFKNSYELARTRESLRGKNWLLRVRKHEGKLPTWEQYHWAKEVKDRRDALIKKHGGAKPVPIWEYDSEDPVLTDPNGPLANYLDISGIRTKNGMPAGGS